MIELREVSKTYNGNPAVRDLSLEVTEGESFGIVGESGCGKTTVLKIVKGDIEPTSGSVFIGDKDVARVPSNKRNVGFLMQTTPIFPRATVEEHVGMGPRLQGCSLSEIEYRVAESLEMLRISHLRKRVASSGELSGGENKRVALAGVIATKPKILLLDEPFTGLDEGFRTTEIRADFVRLVKGLGLTTIFVTHNPLEAAILTTRLALMVDGQIKQVGTFKELYKNPSSVLTARFFGYPKINIVSGPELDQAGFPNIPLHAKIGIRPEDILLVEKQGNVTALVKEITTLGADSAVTLLVGYGITMTALLRSSTISLEIGEKVGIKISNYLSFDNKEERIP